MSEQEMIDLTPNYAELRKQFKAMIVPATMNVLKQLANNDLSEGECADLVGEVNTIVNSIAICLSSAESQVDITELIATVSEANKLTARAFTMYSNL